MKTLSKFHLLPYAFILILLIIGIFLVFFTNRNPIYNQEEDNQVICTMDAKICPDGTTVGREGPNCEFAKCPGE